MADLERAARIRALRDESGLTQQEVADVQNVTLRAYQRQEAGGGLKAENARALADYYKVDLKWLLHGESPDLMRSLSADAAQLDRLEAKLDALLVIQGLDPAGDLPEQAAALAEETAKARAGSSRESGRTSRAT